MKIGAGALAVLVCSAALATEPVQRTLSFDDRVQAQKAIERVYYAHQLGATKPFDEAVPRAVLEAKVRKYLEQSVALNNYWKTPVTDQALQRELERMAQGTKMPERLIELYAALGNDSFLIKECLARPALVDRLTHNFYALDPTMHTKERGRAEKLRARVASGSLDAATEHPNRTVLELVVAEPVASAVRDAQPLRQRLTAEEFLKRRAEFPSAVGQVSAVKETRDALAFSVVLSETATDARVANYLVPKIAWDAWWTAARDTVTGGSVAAVAAGLTTPPAPNRARSFHPLTTCAGDMWDNGSLGALPEGRTFHTAVWTGSVMVIWGGADGYTGDHYIGLNSGGLYDPTTDTWTPTSTVGAPTPRAWHSAAWTGSQMIIWGGIDNTNHFPRSGGRYDPVTDTWLRTSVMAAPIGRQFHTTVWTGRVMVVWGGYTGLSPYITNSGGRYDPTTDSWTPTSTMGAPSARAQHAASWTGTQMVVWGGFGSPDFLNTGGRYDPVADTWTPTSTIGAPPGRVQHTAVWSGHEILFWGGLSYSNSGGRYNPTTDTWSTISMVDAPPPGHSGGGHTAIWADNVMIVWGMYDTEGLHRTGGRYDPATDSWAATSLDGAPSGRAGHTAIWTGGRMIVWGGNGNVGGRYDPINDTWTPTTSYGAPDPRINQSVVWTGNAMVIWGGDLYIEGPSFPGTGGRYDPVIDTWAPTSTTGAPVFRLNHTAVWTGNKMVVWGGRTYDPFAGDLNTGGLYDPIADSWTATSTVDAPMPRELPSAVWTGSTMIVWGGYSLFANQHELKSGGRYDPATDTWTPTSLLFAPYSRVGHTATWTGSEMVIWGGSNPDPFIYPRNTGGRYNPSSDSWTATSLDGAPARRYGHTAVWADGAVLVWGGVGDGNPAEVNTGGLYHPATDTWTSTSLVSAPSPRQYHSAVWTGSEMIIWGGYSNTGGVYSPANDT
jgi:N-acetylneuraminic acid mutarotase